MDNEALTFRPLLSLYPYPREAYYVIPSNGLLRGATSREYTTRSLRSGSGVTPYHINADNHIDGQKNIQDEWQELLQTICQCAVRNP